MTECVCCELVGASSRWRCLGCTGFGVSCGCTCAVLIGLRVWHFGMLCFLQGDNNYGDDRLLYARGQEWLHMHHIMGRAVG